LCILYLHTVRPFGIKTSVAWTATGILISFLITVLTTLKFPYPETKTKATKIQEVLTGKWSIVKVRRANIRIGPGINYSVIMQAKQFDKVEVIDLKNGWYQIKLTDSLSGWIHQDLIVVIE
jgi:uncharacterized protein YgiM (DUF1202 family)